MWLHCNICQGSCSFLIRLHKVFDRKGMSLDLGLFFLKEWSIEWGAHTGRIPCDFVAFDWHDYKFVWLSGSAGLPSRSVWVWISSRHVNSNETNLMRCKSIQTIAQGDAQSESSQSSTIQKRIQNWIQFFGGGVGANSCSHQTSEFHLPASENEKVFVFSALSYIFLEMYRNFVSPYFLQQTQLLGRVRHEGERSGLAAKGAGLVENANNFIYVCFELVFIICQRQNILILILI